MLTIHFVCSGNMCRSPMGEYLLKAKLKKMEIVDVMIDSSGTVAKDGGHVAIPCIAPLQDIGIKIDPHRTKRITREIIERSDYIFVMETHHLKTVTSLAPEHSNKVMMLGDYIDGKCCGDIADPFGGGRDAIYQVFQLINEACEAIAKTILNGKSLAI
ncbi:MAG: low molecular weight protein-tyrosine-phosphatase [Anaerolineales bacterium]|nr:low molecular weight protein-tyrosine-phosphatase [Anaerolineales bacterium]